MNASFSNPAPAQVPVERTPLSRWIVPGILALVGMFDFCFWNRTAFPGLSLAVFFAAVALVIRLSRAAGALSRLACVQMVLLAGAVGEAAIETGFCNVLMLLVLTGAFAAETFFVRRIPGFDRWSAQMRAFMLTPIRIAQLGVAILGRFVFRAGIAGRIASVVVVAVPTLVLVLVFGALLSTGNAVFGLWTQEAFQGVWSVIPDISIYRIVLWMVIAAAAVPLLWPSDAPDRSWNWESRFARWPDIVPPGLAFTTSVVLLVALNAMFFVANYADAIFLWRGGTLPIGVIYSQYVHEGVEMLIMTVMLSALVLASVFNQSIAVAGRGGLKALGGLWIVQNLFLLGSTARRLDLYIEAYGASVERFSTLLFLLLVAAGFGLLTVMILREKLPAWLVGKSMLASFATLYLAQFLNLGGWVADYNVAQWNRHRDRQLDISYLYELGPAAWPALARAEKLGALGTWDADHRGGPAMPAEEEALSPRTRLDDGHWREFSLRAWWNRDALRKETDKK